MPSAEAQSLFLRKTMMAGVGIGLDGFGGLPIVGQLEFGVGPKIGIGRFGVGALAGIYFNQGRRLWSSVDRAIITLIFLPCQNLTCMLGSIS